MASLLPASSENDGCAFLALPAELRNTIYEFSLFSNHKGSELVKLQDICPPSPVVLFVCRQTHLEASDLYRDAVEAYWSTTEFGVIDKEERISQSPIRGFTSKYTSQIRNISIITTVDRVLRAAIGDNGTPHINHRPDRDFEVQLRRRSDRVWICTRINGQEPLPQDAFWLRVYDDFGVPQYGRGRLKESRRSTELSVQVLKVVLGIPRSWDRWNRWIQL